LETSKSDSAKQPVQTVEIRKTKFEEMVESLGVIQDRIVYGDRGAIQEQEEQFIRIAEEFDRMDASKPVVSPDFGAVLVYALSGGEPDVLERFVKVWPPSDTEKNLVEGVRQYVQGNAEESLRLLDPLKPLMLDARLTGPVALAKASLYTPHDFDKASDALDIVRLAEPHTALEEAAIRRQIVLFFDQKKASRVINLAAHYLLRFGKSAHAPKVLNYIGRTFSELEIDDGPSRIAKFNDDLLTIDRALLAEALLSVARGSLSAGKLDNATSSASLCLRLEDASEEQRTRARLYLAVAGAPTEGAANAREILEKISLDALSQDDRDMRAAALRVAASVTKMDGMGEDRAAVGRTNSAESPPETANSNSTIKSVLDRAAGALKSSAEVAFARSQ